MGAASRVFGAIALAAGFMAAGQPAGAQEFPSKPITIIVPLAAGSGMDTIARLYADRLQQSLGKPVIIDNRPGAALMLGAQTLAAAPADGHTLGLATTSSLAINPVLYKQISYDPEKSFIPIALYVKSPFILVVNPDLPVKNVKELIAYARERKDLNYSSPGAGVAQHLSIEYMKAKFGLQITHVPYRNTPQSILDIASGHVQLGFVEAGAGLPLIKDGKLRALAVSSATPLPVLARCAAVRRGVRRKGLRGGVLARDPCAGGHAGRHRPEAARRDEAHHGGAADPREGLGAGPDSLRHAQPRRTADVSGQRARKVGQSGEEPRTSGKPIAPPPLEYRRLCASSALT